MRVIAFVTQKGGSGKSTLAFCCAVAASESGRSALILDSDPQGTAEAWYQDREAETPRLVKVSGHQLGEAVEKAREHGFDTVFIDTPGRDEPATAAAIRAADFCVIPCRPTPGDMKATPPTVATIRRLGKHGAFVLTQTPPRGVRLKEAEAGLSVLGMVCPVHIVHRTAYQDAQGGRLGPLVEEISTPHPVSANSASNGPRGGKRPGVKQQTAYLPEAIYEQLRRLAFEERRKMHDYLMEGLDLVFENRGLPGIAELLKERRGE